MLKNTTKKTVTTLVLALAILVSAPVQTQAAWSDGISAWLKENLIQRVQADKPADSKQSLATVGGIALISRYQPLFDVSKTYDVVITAYSSSPEETDDTPFLTASGELVRDGIVAANFLPFGTKIKIPELFGNKIFVVKDRMATKHSDKIDIWFDSKELAKIFGAKKTEVQILD